MLVWSNLIRLSEYSVFHLEFWFDDSKKLGQSRVFYSQNQSNRHRNLKGMKSTI
jgi:hypothetical protein